MEEVERSAVHAFPVLAQTPAAAEPGEGALHHPAPGQHDEAFTVGALDDLDVYLRQHPFHAVLKLWSLVAAVGIELHQKREQAKKRSHDKYTAVAVLDIGGVHEGREQQTCRID